MNQNYRTKLALFTLFVLGAGIIIGHWSARKAVAPAGHPPAQTDSAPVADVKTVPLKIDSIKAVEITYGTVVTSPSEIHTFSVPYESRVKTIFVTAGSAIQTNSPLITVEPSPDTRLQLAQAGNDREVAQKSFQLVQERLALQLATRQDVLLAQQQLDAAELRVRSFESRGVQDSQTLRADASGVVTGIAVQPGQIIAPGAPLLDTIGRDEIMVRLGLENEDVAHVREGQTVELRSVNGPASQALPGKIRFISGRVNPQTRLVDVFVAPQSAAHFIVDEYVRGDIVLATHEALVAPRTAVLPEDGQEIIYTVENGRAVRHVVTPGLENDQQVEILGDDLKAGTPIVVVGNSQLEPGMAVNQSPAP